MKDFPTRSQALNALIDHVQAWPTQRGIIFCASYNDTKFVARTLEHLGINVVVHYGGLDATVRRRNINEFISNGAWMIATSGFGVGIDIGDVDHVLVFINAYGISQLGQLLGRGGRRGQIYTARVFLCLAQDGTNDDIAAWFQQRGCLVASLAERVDGVRALPCYLGPGRQLCNRCEAIVQPPCMFSLHNAFREVLIFCPRC